MFDLAALPPEGVFYNRMSASSHTRGHRYAAELTAGVLAWLTRHGRRVVNGPRSLDLEVSKARQYAVLEWAGVAVPRTVLVLGEADRVVRAFREHFAEGPVILKPNTDLCDLHPALKNNTRQLSARPLSEAALPVWGGRHGREADLGMGQF